MKKVLAIESCPGIPHTEISLELLIREKEIGSQVFMGLIFQNNQSWEYSMKNPTTDHTALKGLLLSNLKNICNDLNIKCILSENVNSDKISDVIPTLLKPNNKFLDKWDFFTVVLSSVSAVTHKFEPDFNQEPYGSLAKVFADIALRSYYNSLNLIKKVNPDLVYFNAGRWASCIPIGWACTDLGVEYLTHERGSNHTKFEILSYEFLSIENFKREVNKRASVVDKNIVRLIGSEHFSARRNKSASYWPSFTINQKKNEIPKNLREKKYVAYFTSSEDEFSQSTGNKIETYFGRQFEAFDILKKICLDLNILLVVRVHPNVANKHPEEENFWISQADNNTIVFGSKSDCDTYSILDNAYCVVTFATSVGLEAAFSGKPSVLLGNPVWNGENGFYCPKSKEELAACILNATPLEIPDFAFKYGYFFETYGYPYKFYKSEGFWSGKFLGHKLHPAVI